MKFHDMRIDGHILKVLDEMKIIELTEIQQKALPLAIEGKDVIGKAMTGSGKTLVFSIPIIQNIAHGEGIQAFVICPTRELVLQTAEYMRKLSAHTHVSICEVYGGVSLEEQARKLPRTDIVVGTPGRILDHMRRRTIDFRNLRILVLDEADRMLDMGFIDDIRMIIKHLPEKRQTMLFSATIPEKILYITRVYMKHPVVISAQATVSKHKLAQFYYNVRQDEKLSLLVHLIKKEHPRLAIVFCATRRMSDVVGDVLAANGVDAKTLHGGLTQNRRTNLMEGFHRGRPHVLVATDVAARGLDIKDISHIFNYDVPQSPDDYTHRIGRTARIGKEGKAITLLTKNDHEAFRKIVREMDIECLEERDFPKLKRTYAQQYPQRDQRRRFPRRFNRY
ncbi:MAG: DEAD/DEAH box helicase [Candidatus Aenigmarchaeota archaeon]|nr:DEAD/DEAH box helicase [Candidatus Aenigmarchaeota archaeon]